MMAIHLQEEINKLKRELLDQSARVEREVQRAMHSIERGDTVMANEVIDADLVINAKEVDIEEDCLKVLALHQPVAADLRFIISVIKINSDLERIADVAVNIAKRTIKFDKEKKVEAPFDYPVMMEKVLKMLKNSLDSLVKLDSGTATAVIDADDEIDDLHRLTYDTAKKRILEQPAHLQALLLWVAVSRHLERIADLSAHIAEDVVYLVEGNIVRHRTGG
ncbi:MAG: phosphate signaling complex protein PhoU [Desulfuromonadaceae bacterium]